MKPWLALSLPLALAAMSPAFAAQPDFIFGVGTHFAFPEHRGYMPPSQRPNLRALGVTSFRDDVHEGAFTVSEPDHPLGRQINRLNDILLDRDLRPVLILIGRQLAAQPYPRSAPTSPRERELYANFASRVVAGTQSLNPIYEIWNEWNTQWRPRQPVLGPLGMTRENPDYGPENYVELAKVTYDAIKRTNPAALVFTGSIGDDENWAWTRRAVKAGLERSGDGISVHFYNHCNQPSQRTAEDLIRKTESFQAAVRQESTDKPLPIYVTEFGWPNDEGSCGIPRDLAAANFAQYALWAPTTGWIKGIWAYEMRDSGRNKQEREDNFGLFDYDNKPKPAACSYREASDLARSFESSRFLQAPDGVRWLEGKRADGKVVWAVWATERDKRFSIARTDGAAFPARPLCADSSIAASQGVGMMPLVIEAGPTDKQASYSVR